MAGLVEVLQLTISQNQADQTAALEFLRNACESHYAEFVQELINVLVNVDNPAFVRQAAGLQLKNTLASKELELSDVYHQRWIALPAAVRQTVKNAVLQTLGTEQRPSTAAQCVAAISCIELPVNEWPDVIDRLVANVTNAGSQAPSKESSLEALGYICQDMSPAVMESRFKAILAAILHGMRADEPSARVRLAAVNALLNWLEFTRSHFGNEWPNVIDRLVANVTNAGSQAPLKESSLEALGYICQDMPPVVMESRSNAILAAILHGMRADEPSAHVRLAAVNALLNSLEFTRSNFGSEWPEVIDRLMANVTNAASQEPLKESSLEALGYICRNIPPAVMESRSNAILTAIVHGMRADEPSAHVRLAAVNALLNSLEFTRSNFGNEQELNIIMEVTCQAYQSAYSQIKVVALQCLVKIMSWYYQYMERYMSGILPITIEAMKSEVMEVALEGIKFWSIVFKKEIVIEWKEERAEKQGTVFADVSKDYARRSLESILPILAVTFFDSNNDKRANAAGHCISLLSRLHPEIVIRKCRRIISRFYFLELGLEFYQLFSKGEGRTQ